MLPSHTVIFLFNTCLHRSLLLGQPFIVMSKPMKRHEEHCSVVAETEPAILDLHGRRFWAGAKTALSLKKIQFKELTFFTSICRFSKCKPTQLTTTAKRQTTQALKPFKQTS